jgi:4-hydroxy-3-polyprenylbenzoate decarboxylase
VNEDIDPDNADARSGRCLPRQPGADLQVAARRDQGHGRAASSNGEDASVLIDADAKENFPPISLPKRESWSSARTIWEELGRRSSSPNLPGTATRSASGRTSSTRRGRGGARRLLRVRQGARRRRRKDLPMNTEVRDLRPSGEHNESDE